MPKRKEVHLKKLIKGGEESHKGEQPVCCFSYNLMEGIKNAAYRVILALEPDTWNRYR